MAHLVIVIDTDNHSIADLNGKVNFGSTKPHECVQGAKNYLDAVLAGAVNADVQITTRDTDPSVSTSGSGSAQIECTMK